MTWLDDRGREEARIWPPRPLVLLPPHSEREDCIRLLGGSSMCNKFFFPFSPVGRSLNMCYSCEEAYSDPLWPWPHWWWEPNIHRQISNSWGSSWIVLAVRQLTHTNHVIGLMRVTPQVYKLSSNTPWMNMRVIFLRIRGEGLINSLTSTVINLVK